MTPPSPPGAPGHHDFVPSVLLRSEQTGGHISVVESRVPARWPGPPLHHHRFDETFYVLEGELVFQVDDELAIRRPGEAAFAAGGVHHAFANAGDVPARYLVICAPAGFERYFDRIAATASGAPPPPEAALPYPETIVVGPPIDHDAVRRARS